jgi:hypothetical protein
MEVPKLFISLHGTLLRQPDAKEECITANCEQYAGKKDGITNFLVTIFETDARKLTEGQRKWLTFGPVSKRTWTSQKSCCGNIKFTPHGIRPYRVCNSSTSNETPGT